MKIQNKQKGITLVALAITIIILLILAGITINALTDNGLFGKAKLAKETAKNAQEKEREEIETITNNILEGKYNNKTTIWDELKKEGFTIRDIINSKEKLDIILSDNESIEEMMKTEEIRKEILNSSVAIETISENKYVIDKIVNNSKWTEEIINNKNTIEYLKKSSNYAKNPITNINTQKIIKSSCYGSEDIWGAWKCFDGRVGIGGAAFHWSSKKANNEYIGYIFDEPIWIFEVNINNGVQDTVDYGAKTVQIQYSDNGKDYTTVSDEVKLEKINSKQTVPLKTYTGKHLYWRLFIKDGYSTEFISISELEFSGIK